MAASWCCSSPSGIAAGGGEDDDETSTADETTTTAEPETTEAETTEAPATTEAPVESTEPPAPDVEGEPGEVDDVTIAECTEDAAGMVARLAVTNDSSKRSTYSIDVTIEGADGSQLGTAIAFVDNLEPDQSTQTDAHR